MCASAVAAQGSRHRDAHPAHYAGLVFADVGVLVRILFALALVVGCTAISTGIMHDANHGAFSRSKRVNRLLGYSSDLLGGSSYLWPFKHNVLHHRNTNVMGYDTDTDTDIVAPRLEQARRERGIDYHRRHPSLIAAVRSLARWLRLMGRRPLPPPTAARDSTPVLR
jgi:fatty acid desaturase